MPALKMKSKSSADYLRGRNINPCHKSTKASKYPHSQVETSQQAAVLDNSNQNLSEASPNIGSSCQNIQIAEATGCSDIFTAASSQCLKLPSSSSDLIYSGAVASASVPCSSNMETIFSPNFGHEETHTKNDSVRDGEAELPHLVADGIDDRSYSLSYFQNYSALDLYIYDNASASPFDIDMGFTDAMNTTCPDFGSMDSDMIIDMADRYMMLPFFEKTVNTCDIPSEDFFEGASDDACLYLAIQQMELDQETDISRCFGDLEEMGCIEQQLAFRNLSEAASTTVRMHRETRKRKPVTLVLDLDETLVHSTLEYCNDADFTFTVFFNMKDHTVYVRRRPYLQPFLEKVAQMFEVVIFTASQSIYAEQLLDVLDPDGSLITQRIYRESCIFSDGNYTKDLTILGVDLEKVAIIDNSPQVFRLQVNNGIPIASWYDDPSDNALISLLPFLETLVDAVDVRPIIAKRFGSKE